MHSRTRLWGSVSIVVMLVMAVFLAGGCSKESTVVEPRADEFDVTLAGKPSSFTGTIVVDPVNIPGLHWELQGIKKNRNASDSGDGAETLPDMPAGDWTLTYGPVEGIPGIAEYTTLEGKLKFNQTKASGLKSSFSPESNNSTLSLPIECNSKP